MGARLVVADVNLELAKQTCESFRAGQGGENARLVPFRCDVAAMEEVADLIKFTVNTFGALHHCFNNAGTEGRRAPFHETSAEDFMKVMGVNAGGIFNCMSQE